MKIEQVKDAETPAEMRAELQRMTMHDPLTNKVMAIADRQRMTSEDRYTVLAYYALKALCGIQQRAIEDTVNKPLDSAIAFPAGK